MLKANKAPIHAALTLCRQHFIAAAAFSALVNILYIAPTLYMLQVYDRVLQTQGLQTLAFLTAILLFALLALATLDRARQRLLARAGARMDTVLTPLILDASLGRPTLAISRQGLREFDQMRETLTGPGMLALFDAPWVPIYLFVCFLVHPWIGVIASFGCVLLPIIAYANARVTKFKNVEAQRVARITYANQDMLLSSAESVRALGMRRAMVARQVRQRASMLRAQTLASLASGSYFAFSKFVRLALQSLALGLGALLAIDHKISAGAIFASAFLLARTLQPIEQLIGAWRSIAQFKEGYTNLGALLDDSSSQIPTQLPDPCGGIILEDVTILNEARESPVLRSISLSIRPGEVIALIGPSGAGKSTLARALAGAIPLDRGHIRFDHSDITNWEPERLAKHIGYLPQDITFFAGTIAENIARFAGELSHDRNVIDANVIAAARKVSAHALITRLSSGYDYLLGLGGKGLSAGQAQRVAFARAVYGDPAILILDEPNAHLDKEGDDAMVAALAILKSEGKTILIVSHKLSILPVVDRILVLRDGTADMFGPRDKVLAKIAAPKVQNRPPAAFGDVG